MEHYPCPDSSQLSRAFTEGADVQLRDHLRNCESCFREWEQIERLQQVGKEIPYDVPSKSRLDQVRIGIFAGALTSDALMRRSRRRIWQMALLALLCMTLVLSYGLTLFNAEPDSIPVQLAYRAAVEPQGIATYSVSRTQPDEIIKLMDGTILVTVDPLKPSESVRVVVGNSRVEVRGTVFEVLAKNNRLLDVRVIEGRVEVHTIERLPVVLVAGNRLSEDPTFASLHPVPPEPVQPVLVAANIPLPQKHLTQTVKAPKTASLVTPSAPVADNPVVASPVQKAFETGWTQLKAGQYSLAAQSFASAHAQNKQHPLAEDAAYWQAVSLKYAAQPGQAKTALQNFVDQYPFSPRRGEASVMLGWMLLDQGQWQQARSLFSNAQQDRVAKVRTSATRGLEAIAVRQEADHEADQ